MSIVNLKQISLIEITDVGFGKKDHYEIMADCIVMGNYSTEEKAVKVLDMIQNAYTQYGTLVDGRGSIQGAFALPKVFQMPQNREV